MLGRSSGRETAFPCGRVFGRHRAARETRRGHAAYEAPPAWPQFCRYGDKIGTIESIGLRSTRVRSLDRTIVTIPNAEFSSLQLENFAARDRIRFHTVLGLRYETTADQLRFALVELRRFLLSHPRVNPDPARVRFVGFGAYSLDLEVFAQAR